jgi:poly(3-hydroxybutyrate) depolymerase
VPLIVTLHGDYQPVGTMHEAWRKLARDRGIAVLSLACPWNLGCRGSYWRWDGAPAWVDGEVAKVEARRPIDRDRLWLVGWSGGGSYIGWRTQKFSKTFAAIVIHGGGMPPNDPTCTTEKTPVYFLVGDKNPFHQLAKRLRDHYTSCGSDVTWDLLRGAEHDVEWSSLTTHGRTVVDWLVAHPRPARIP